MYVFLCIFFKHFFYPIFIILIALELHRYIYMRYLIKEEDEDGDREFHEPSIEMCSRCRNPNCGHRLADYTED